MSNEINIDLTNLHAGAAIEFFDRELQRVLKNIQDINTKPDALREINLKFKFKPTEDRNAIAIEISAGTKLAAHNSVRTLILTGQDARGTIHAEERYQPELDFNETDNIVDMPQTGENHD